jgi:sigma-B regulation protein RsbU (phosphoserine phosphatase)
MEDQKIAQLETEVQRLKSAVEELMVLNDLAIAAGTTLEVKQMLDTIVEKATRAVKAEQGSILLVTEEKDAPLKTFIRQQVDQHSRMMTYKVGTSITGWVLTYQQPLLIENLATDTRFHATEQEKKDIRSVLCVPMRYKGKLIGILIVTNKRTLEPFSPEDLRLLSIIAAQSGQLIQNSKLQEEALQKKKMEQELAVARDIQLSLVPRKVPDIKGVEISSFFKPADEVGGDYYDYFLLGEDRVGVLVADVSGHGVSAALVMAMVKGILHTITQRFESADRLLFEMNAILHQILPKEMFVTLMFLVFELKRRILRYSCAGHPPLLFYRSQSKSSELTELRGPALGITKLSAYKESEIPLTSGDVFVLYTDGITEAVNEQMEMFEAPRLMQAVEEVASSKAWEIVEHVKKRLREFAGKASQNDDVALIAVKVTD